MAYDNFLGTNSKKVFNEIGFKGLLGKLKGKDRKGKFKTVAAYCEPGKNAKLFVGVVNGFIAEEVRMPNNLAYWDRLPLYTRIDNNSGASIYLKTRLFINGPVLRARLIDEFICFRWGWILSP